MQPWWFSLQAYEIVMNAVMAEHDDGYAAAVGRKNADGAVLALADVGCAVADSPLRPIAESLAGRAVMAVYPEKQGTEARFGGLDGVISGVYASRQAMENVESAKLYLTAAQTARLILMLAAVLLPVPMLSPVCILAWGLLFDFAAVLVMAFEHGRGQRLRFVPAERHDDPDDAPRDRRGVFLPVLAGIVWAAVTAGAAYLYTYLCGLVKLDCDGGVFLYCALILSVLIVSCSIMKPHSLLRVGRINTAFTAFALTAVILIPVILIAAEMTWPGRLLCLGVSLIPALILLAVSEIVKRVQAKM